MNSLHLNRKIHLTIVYMLKLYAAVYYSQQLVFEHISGSHYRFLRRRIVLHNHKILF